MAQTKLDGVIEAVHYTGEGRVDWVRVYERRGPTFSDRIVISRDDLIGRLKAGKKYFAGQRIKYQASTFELAEAVRVEQAGGEDFLAAGKGKTNQDYLEGIPFV